MLYACLNTCMHSNNTQSHQCMRVQVCEAAWRWRFGRRWVNEQAKQFDPEQAEDAEEEWDDALGYLDACGPGFNLIARTSSEFAERGLNRQQSLLSQDSAGSKSLNSLLMDDYSLKEVFFACQSAIQMA